jgi:hypothetical protein
MGKNEKGISVDSFQQPLFKNGGKVPEARNRGNEVAYHER